jgi:subtilase family serine protease
VSSVKADATKNVKLKCNLPIGTSASGQYLIAVIDPDNVIPETNKGNNVVVYGPVP